MQTKPMCASYLMGQLPEGGKCDNGEAKGWNVWLEKQEKTMGMQKMYIASLSFTPTAHDN